MPEEILVPLFVEDGRLHTSPPGLADPHYVPGTHFTFRLLAEDVEFPPCRLRQLWMDKRDLYPLRGAAAPMFLPVVEAFWSLCLKHATVFHDDVQDTYLLAHLLPHVRSNAARGVVLDSMPTAPAAKRTRLQAVQELDEVLRKATESQSLAEFHLATANALGPRGESDEAAEDTAALYDEMEEELLGKGREALQKRGEAAGREAVVATWAAWQRSFGRRSGHEERKRVAAVFSYEAKAALHRAYSAVWHELLSAHAASWGLSPQSLRFHRFWHCEPLVPSERFPGIPSSLLHGHVPALHPAAAAFASTQTGRSFIGAWLERPDRERLERLLGDLAVATFHYASHVDETRMRRRGRSSKGLDLEGFAEPGR